MISSATSQTFPYELQLTESNTCKIKRLPLVDLYFPSSRIHTSSVPQQLLGLETVSIKKHEVEYHMTQELYLCIKVPAALELQTKVNFNVFTIVKSAS